MITSNGGAARYLQHLTNNVAKALETGGMLVEQRAQERAPIHTGTMMRSVTHTPALLMGGALTVYVGPGPEAPYAIYTEEDEYLPKNLGPKSVIKGTATIPWLRPALADEKQDILALIETAIRSTRP